MNKFPNPNWSLGHIRSKPNLNANQMYEYFYTLVRDNQLRLNENLKTTFKVIEEDIRKYSIITDDEEEQKKNAEKVALLLELKNKIVDANLVESDKFLKALTTVFEYTQS